MERDVWNVNRDLYDNTSTLVDKGIYMACTSYSKVGTAYTSKVTINSTECYTYILHLFSYIKYITFF